MEYKMNITDRLAEAIQKTIRGHYLSFSREADDETQPYPLVDALTPEGAQIIIGEHEIEYLVDHIMGDLLPILTDMQKSEPVSNPYKLPTDREKALDWLEETVSDWDMETCSQYDYNAYITIRKALQQPEEAQ